MITRAEASPTSRREGDPPGGADPWPRLTEGCRRGDGACFAEVVALTEPRLRRLLGRMIGGRCDLDDIVQETYLRAWRNLPGFRGESLLPTWLTRIAINVAKNLGRSRRTTVALADAPEPTAAPSSPRWRDLQLLAAYEKALARLSPEMRATFLLHETEGMTYQGVAEALGCPIGTVMSRLHRARTQILDELRAAEGDWGP